MPFTLAHAAAAVPFRRTKLPLSALVIGCFAPDFEYFLRMAPDDRYGHTLKGAVLLTFPVALLTLWLFHRFVKKPVVRLLPSGLECRLQSELREFPFTGAARFSLIALALALGIASHLVWDMFTHINTWTYQQWPMLRSPVHVPVTGMMPLYKVLQHSSTVLGTLLLLVWFAMWYRATVPDRECLRSTLPAHRKLVVMVWVVVISVVGSFVRAVAELGIPDGAREDFKFSGLVVASLIALLWWQLLLYGIWKDRLRRGDA